MRKKREKLIESEITDLCEQAGCTLKEKINHAWKWEMKRWHSHPFASFLAWWNPDGSDETTGASVGGHPDSYRLWARPREGGGGYTRRYYGIKPLDAWNCAIYVQQFSDWQDAGSPERDEPFVSNAVSGERQREFWRSVKAQIAKPFPPTLISTEEPF